MKKVLLSALCISILFGCNLSMNQAIAAETQTNTSIEKIQVVSPYKNMSYEELTDLVNTIGNNLVKSNNIKKNITFKVDMQDIDNASTDIENTVTVYKGIIDCCENADELAFIIGHELGHASSNHVIKAVGANVAGNAFVNAFKSIVSWFTKSSSVSDIALKGADIGSNLASTAAQNKYSRVHEFDADLLGIDYVTKAGYNPNAAMSIMTKIGENYPDFWIDHPSTDKRTKAMKEHIQENYSKYLESAK
ncbi:M48 family metalloprotease [bacterium]|nr:M48 family metalloprotease [bacterium]